MNTQEPLSTPHPTHELIKSILLGLVILAAGIAIGASLTFLRLSRPMDRPDREPELVAEQTLRQLSHELNLTPQQRQQLEPIFQKHYRVLNELRTQLRPKIVAELEQLNSEIASVLDEPQRRLWQQRVRRLEQHFPTFRGRGRGPGQEFIPERGGQRPPMGPGLRRPGPMEPPQEPQPPLPPRAPEDMPPVEE